MAAKNQKLENALKKLDDLLNQPHTYEPNTPACENIQADQPQPKNLVVQPQDETTLLRSAATCQQEKEPFSFVWTEEDHLDVLYYFNDGKKPRPGKQY